MVKILMLLIKCFWYYVWWFKVKYEGMYKNLLLVGINLSWIVNCLKNKYIDMGLLIWYF